jgi:hypothetical protein
MNSAGRWPHRLVLALRGTALVAGLLWVLGAAFAGGHDHHALGASSDPLPGDGCAACTLAHAPALGPPKAPTLAPDARPALPAPSRAPLAPPPAPVALPDGRGPPTA